jgi:DNA-binding MarR family transcriptional regulator
MQLLIPWEDASLPLMLTVVRSRLRQVSWRLLAPYGITPQQYQVLRVLSDSPGLCHGQLAGALGLDKPTATRLLQALQRKGWVDVLPHPSHGRKLRLELSADGQALVTNLVPFRKTVREGLEEGLEPGERKALRDMLHKLKLNLDHMDEALDTAPPGMP